MLSSNSSFARGNPGFGTVGRLGAVAVVMVLALGAAPAVGTAGGPQGFGKWGGPIDAEALQILKSMTDYLGGLQQFSLHTENTYEDVLETGQKIQFGFSTEIVIQRPNKLMAQRTDGLSDQIFVFDGSKLVIYDGHHDFFSSVEVPDNLDDFLHFARDSLDLVPPAGDLVFTNAFDLLTAGISSGFVVGTAVVEGVSCHHLAFTTPVVDWQVWIADGDKPLPYRYVLTTRDDPAQPQFVTTVSNWDTSPGLEAGAFDFEPPATATEIDFVGTDAGIVSAR